MLHPEANITLINRYRLKNHENSIQDWASAHIKCRRMTWRQKFEIIRKIIMENQEINNVAKDWNMIVTTVRRAFNDYKSNGIENFIKMIKRDDKEAISEDLFWRIIRNFAKSSNINFTIDDIQKHLVNCHELKASKSRIGYILK